MTRMEKLRKHILNELVFELDGEEVLSAKPVVGDKTKLLTSVSGLKETETDKATALYEDHLYEIFARELKDDPDFTEDDLRTFISDNNLQLIKQLLIQYKITSEDAIKEKTKQKH